jgi:DNA-binding transcriptional LysR family regulator
MDIELRHLRYFVAVAEELHFGHAANRLHLAQPPLSQQIRKLEEIVGYPLFTRTSRAVRLTSPGAAFLERARHTLRKVEKDVEEARRIGRGEIGSLNVGFIGSGMLTPLPGMLGRYRSRFSQVNLQLREFYTASALQALQEGTIDVGILRDAGPTDGFVVEPLISESFIAIVPKRSPLAKRATLSPADLRNEPFVFFSATVGSRAYAKSISVCEEHGFRPRVVQEAPQFLTIIQLVGAGLGVTITPACVAQIATSTVVVKKLRQTSARSEIELAYRAGEDRAIVKTFCDMARTYLSSATK